MVQEDAIRIAQNEAQSPESTLILGWNEHAPSIINELDNYVVPGSKVTVLADFEDGEGEIARLCPDLVNETVTYQNADTTNRRVLEAVHPETYSHVVVLSYAETKEIQEADACTLMTLLHLRDMADKLGHNFPIVSEMLDLQNRALAEVTHADDFIVSEKIVGLLITQVAENKALNAVFTDIFDPEGSEIYLKPARNYVKLDTPLNFYTVIESAARRGEVAFGYRLKADAGNAEKAYGVKLNPDKAEKISFGKDDLIVVLAES